MESPRRFRLLVVLLLIVLIVFEEIISFLEELLVVFVLVVRIRCCLSVNEGVATTGESKGDYYEPPYHWPVRRRRWWDCDVGGVPHERLEQTLVRELRVRVVLVEQQDLLVLRIKGRGVVELRVERSDEEDEGSAHRNEGVARETLTKCELEWCEKYKMDW